jgi:hypothetical protein
MKTLIYISGIISGVLIVLRLVGIFMEFSFNSLILNTALILLGLICLPLYFVDKHRHDKKIKMIIASRKGKSKEKKKIKEGKTKIKGWDMNTSPFHDRKSGVTYEGGNIYGKVGKRNSRRSFLR